MHTYSWARDFDDEPIPAAFCDVPNPHERHVYNAINGRQYACNGLTVEELAAIIAYENSPESTCEHGLSAQLCGGPNHWYD